MTSPFRSSDHSSSSPRSTPSRSLQNGNPRVNGYHHSLRESVNDSPSRQLLEEFGRMLINDDRAFKRSLDEQTAAQHQRHLEALDRALAKHEEVRESAERVRERVELEIERERTRREQEERKATEKARRDLEEQRLQEQKLHLEETRAREEERRQRAALEREEAEAKQNAEAQKQRETQESQRAEAQRQQQAAEASRKAAQNQAGSSQSGGGTRTIEQGQGSQVQTQSPTTTQQPSTAAVQPNGVSSQPQPATSTSRGQSTPGESSWIENLPKGIVSSVEEREAIHRQYLDLHQRLKQMREHVSEEVKKTPGLKNQLSDWRRAIQKCCGQLAKPTTEAVKTSNRRATNEIVRHLDAAAAIAEPSIDVTQYLVQNKQPPNANKQGPAALVFLLNYFAKNIISQFISESAVDPKTGDVIGVLAVTVFARQQYLFNGQSLIDLLWAKYHKTCPVLFGISGSERSRAGRARLGWHVEGEAFVQEQRHYDRTYGLGVGFAAVTLRDFSKSNNNNPAPNRIYWESIARILNTPAAETQPTHFVVLKAMIDGYVPRIIGHFGGAGLALLRQALITFPNERGPEDEKGNKTPAVTALQTLPRLLERDLALTL